MGIKVGNEIEMWIKSLCDMNLTVFEEKNVNLLKLATKGRAQTFIFII